MNFLNALWVGYLRKYNSHLFYLFIIFSIAIGVRTAFITKNFFLPLLFSVFLIIAEKSERVLNKYVSAGLSLVFFVIVICYSHPEYEHLTLILHFIPVIYAYLLPDILSSNISGFITVGILHLYIGQVAVYRLLYSSIGILTTSLILSVIFRMLYNLVLERNTYKAASITDSLTGLVNFSHIIKVGQEMIDNEQDVAVYIVDLDYFKQVNDIYGHIVGNEVIIKVANTLKEALKSYNCVLGRLGGDEFIILVKGATNLELKILMKKLNNKLNKETFYKASDDRVIKISCSIGKSQNRASTIDELIHEADMDMYQRKYGAFDKDMCVNIGENLITEQIKQILTSIKEKDKYTYIHSQFVAGYSVKVGRVLGFQQKKLEELYIAGLLHDIGKIFVSNSILKRPGKLTEEEHEIIKGHVNIAVNNLDILGFKDFIMIKDAIKYHHERWDGKGYPFGVKGDEIPLWARILQVADVYSAVTIKRVHKERISMEEATEEIKRCSGTQLDPELVDVFLKVLE